MRVSKHSFRAGTAALSLTAIVLMGEAALAPAHGQFGGYGGWFGGFPGYGSGYGYPSYRRDRTWHRPRARARKPSPPPVNVNAPPAQKRDQPPKEVAIVIGDSLAEWLAYGLEQNLDEDESDTRDIGVVRKIRSNAGLIDNCRGELRKWLHDSLASDKAQKPAFVAVMMGFSDRKPIKDCAEADAGSRASGRGDDTPDSKLKSAEGNNDKQKSADASYDFRTEEWTARYGKRIDEALAVLKSKGVPVFWVGLPAARGVRAADIGALNDLYRERAGKAGVHFVDVWDGFVDDNGDFSLRGPDVNGQVRLLRAADGTHFSKAGASKLAHYLEQGLKRASVTIQEPPQAQPAPAPAPDKNTPRPVAGPVVPLSADAKGDELVGSRSPDSSAAARFFRDGVAPAPSRGRADDFAWPRPSSGSTELLGGEPQEATPPPPAAAPKIPVQARGYAKGERRR